MIERMRFRPHAACLRWIVRCLAALGALLPALAVASNYEFSDRDFLAPAAAFSSWAETLNRHQHQYAALTDCEAAAGACPGRLRSYQRMLQKGAALSREEQVSLVNLYINRSRYRDERPEQLYDEDGTRTGVQRNRFGTLYEFLTERGDCEDYAVAKYFMLRELGFAAEDMRVVVTRERREPGYHAILALRMEKGEPNGRDVVWLLDTDNSIRRKRHFGYRFVYAMNEHAVWDHRTDDHLSLRQWQRGR